MTELSLSEQAYGQLRRMIVRLDFAPGDVLREEALQETPVSYTHLTLPTNREV